MKSAEIARRESGENASHAANHVLTEQIELHEEEERNCKII